MNLEQNEELAKQILRTGMYANLYDKETTYGYLTYLTYRVEDTLFTWKRKAMRTVLGRPHMGGIYCLLQREKTLLLAAQRVLLSTVMAFPASAFDFTLEEAEVDFPVTRYDSAGMLHMAKLYSFENCISIVEFLCWAEGVLSIMEGAAGTPLHMGALYRGAASQPKGICGPLSRAFRNALVNWTFSRRGR